MNKFKKVEDGWREVLVDVDETGERLRYIISRNATPSCVLLAQDGVREAVEGREMVEMSPSAWTMAKMISERIVEHGGAALIADYGHDGGGDGDTLRAFRHHRQVDPLELPGTADITADVDFGLLRTQVIQTVFLLVWLFTEYLHFCAFCACLGVQGLRVARAGGPSQVPAQLWYRHAVSAAAGQVTTDHVPGHVSGDSNAPRTAAVTRTSSSSSTTAS